MMDQYGSDFITVSDEDGKEFELEILSTLEYNGAVYMAVAPAGQSQEDVELALSILKVTEEDGEDILGDVEDEDEWQAVYGLFMDSLYEDGDE